MSPSASQRGSNRRRRQMARRSAARRRRRVAIGLVLGLLVIVGVLTAVALGGRSPARSSPAVVGQPAPDGAFTTVSNQTVLVSALRGQPTLLWFVATWCPSCQAGMPAVAQNLAALQAKGVKVEVIELYGNLGQAGPTLEQFAHVYAGPAESDRRWTFATSSAPLSYTYNPKGYPDIYYLLDAQGRIAYANSSPAATMPNLLAKVNALT